MRLKSIALEGFQSYLSREVVDLDGLSMVAVVGPNGAGKTSLLNGIEFALFGKYRGDGINSIISRGAKQAQVTVEFVLNGSTYRVRRVKTSSRHEVYVSVADEDSEDGWKVLEEKNPKMADPFLRDLIGMDYETARTTWLIGQHDFGAFCELQPAQRRTVLTNAFGLNRYIGLTERAEQNLTAAEQSRREVESRLQQHTSRREALMSEVNDPDLHPLTDDELAQEEKRVEREDERVTADLSVDLGDVDDLQKKVAAAQRNLQEALSAHEKDVARHGEDTRRAERAVKQASEGEEQARRRRDEAATAAWGVVNAQEDLAAAQEKVEAREGALPGLRDAVMEQVNSISTHAARIEAAITHGHEVNERIAVLQRTAHGHDGECFACGQSLTEDRAQEMLTRLNTEKAQLKEQHDSSRDAHARAQEDKKANEQAVSAAEQELRVARQAMQRAEQEHRDASRASDALPQLEEALASAETTTKEARAELQAMQDRQPPALDEERVQGLREEVSSAEEKLRAAKESSGNRQELRSQRDQLRSLQKRVWAEQQHRERVSVEVARLEQPIKDLQGSQEALVKDVVTYRTLREAFSPAGIPAMILAGVIEELNDDANDVLTDLGGQFGVNVTTQREKATGGVDEKVMVYVTTPEGEVDYSTLSGSERFRCALSLRIALARCIARRTGTPIETIIMDEGWGSLDEEYRQAVQEVLMELSGDFAVFTVSHIEEIKAAFPTVIEVDKASGTSRVEVHPR